MIKAPIILLAGAMLFGCTQSQRFDILKNARLDDCAMKRMSSTKISGQWGYQKAHEECHAIVNIEKFHEMKLFENHPAQPNNQVDPFVEYAGCVDYIKGIVADKYYPELRVSKSKINGEAHKNEDERITNAVQNLRDLILPDKFSQLDTERLLMIRNAIVDSPYPISTKCPNYEYSNLEKAVNIELSNRHSYSSK
jgi:hypothetical protein